MTTIRRVTGMVVIIGAAAGCAVSASSSTAGPLRFAGDFRMPSGYSSAVLAPGANTSAATAYGSITLTPDASDSSVTRADVSVTIPSATGRQLAWAVLLGPCGSATATVTGSNEFPLIDISSSAAGTVHTSLPVRLDEHATYHANIYNSSRSNDQGEVIMCANLARAGHR